MIQHLLRSQGLGVNDYSLTLDALHLQHPRLLVAVGMRVAPHPPHRSQRAELPHWAPTSGSDVHNQTCRIRSIAFGKSSEQAFTAAPLLALCPVLVLLEQIPLGQAPSLHNLRQRESHPLLFDCFLGVGSKEAPKG
jgi:hypothetical protein